MKKPVVVEAKSTSKTGTRQGTQTAQSQAGTSEKGLTLEQKKQARLAELNLQYDTIRAKPFSLAV